MDAFLELCRQMGAAVCHQLPERSFWYLGTQFPLCARCTGIYTGAFFAFCFLFLKKRRRGNQPFSKGILLLSCLALLPVAADGFFSYLGLWQSNQLLRVGTGALAGAVLPALFLLAGNFDPVGKNEEPIYRSPREPLALLGISLLWGMSLWAGAPLLLSGTFFSIGGLLCFWAGIFYLLLRNLLPKKSLPFWLIAFGLAAVLLGSIGRLKG